MPARHTITETEARREILESAHHPQICAAGEPVREEVAEAWAMGFLDLPGPLAYHDAHTMVWCEVA